MGRVPIKYVERRYFRWFPLVRGEIRESSTQNYAKMSSKKMIEAIIKME